MAERVFRVGPGDLKPLGSTAPTTPVIAHEASLGTCVCGSTSWQPVGSMRSMTYECSDCSRLRVRRSKPA
jgi:hypothetical protein